MVCARLCLQLLQAFWPYAHTSRKDATAQPSATPQVQQSSLNNGSDAPCKPSQQPVQRPHAEIQLVIHASVLAWDAMAQCPLGIRAITANYHSLRWAARALTLWSCAAPGGGSDADGEDPDAYSEMCKDVVRFLTNVLSSDNPDGYVSVMCALMGRPKPPRPAVSILTANHSNPWHACTGASATGSDWQPLNMRRKVQPLKISFFVLGM